MNELYLSRMWNLLGEESDAYEACLKEPPFKGIRVNTLRLENRKIEGLAESPSPFADNGWYVNRDEKIGGRAEYLTGCVYAQEPSASFAVTVLDPKPGMKVLDLCAAPGSKSTQIAEKLQGCGLLVANEYVPARAKILKENIERHGIADAVVLNSDPDTVAEAFPRYFDAVLCDAPCSGEGMFRKEEEAIQAWSEEAVRSCAKRQGPILEAAYRCLKPGGVLVYSTCTFSREENEDNVVRLLEAHPDLELVSPGKALGHNGLVSAYPTELCRRIYPMDGGEGHFVAKFHRFESEESFSSPSLLKSDPMPKEAEAFLNEHLERPYPYYYVKKGHVYGGTFPFVSCGKARLVRHQVPLGTFERGRFEPSHAMAMSSYARFLPRIELSEPELLSYRKGETLAKSGVKGWAAVTVGDQPAGLVKGDGRILKNHYPKSFRIR